MNALEALKIARIAYKQINDAIQTLETQYEKEELRCCWDGCIQVDDHFFTERELMGEKIEL